MKKRKVTIDFKQFNIYSIRIINEILFRNYKNENCYRYFVDRSIVIIICVIQKEDIKKLF